MDCQCVRVTMKIKVIVKTNSRNNEVKFDNNFDAYRVSVKAKPVEGEANKEVLKLLKKYFKKEVRIISGFKSNRKVIEVG